MAEPQDLSNAVKLVGITATTFTRFSAIRTIQDCRARFPEALIVAGGCHFGNCAEDSLKHIPELDVVVRGDGDHVIVDLMRVAEKKLPIETLQGISYRDRNGNYVEQGPRLVVTDLPDLGFMRRFYSMDDFRKNPLNPQMPIPSMNLLAGRGCPNECIFCSVGREKNRCYPPNVLVDVIEEITKQHGIKGVKFFDNSLTLRQSYVHQLCDELLRRRLDIYWFCDSRADIDLELLPLMHAAGCRFISVGLESGFPRIQRVIKKQVTNEQVLAFAAKCREAGIRAFIFLMAGFPDEREEGPRNPTQRLLLGAIAMKAIPADNLVSCHTCRSMQRASRPKCSQDTIGRCKRTMRAVFR